MIAWLKKFYTEAKTKLTTWFALALAGIAALPDLIPQYWANVEAMVPTHYPTEAVHHLLLGVGALAVIYLRVRRAVNAVG